MANKDYYATVKLYYAPFKADERLIFDSADYLENVCTLRKEVQGFQYVRGAIETTIKVNIGATSLDYPKPIWNRAYVNYVFIETVSEYPQEGTRASNKYCYFISEIDQIDMDTLKLYLRLDTLNTLAIMQNGSNNIPWSPRTHITREHKDRYLSVSSGKVFPKVDYMSEGIILQKRLRRSVEVGELDNWYLVYRTEYDAGKTEDNPLRLFLVPSTPTKFETSGVGSVPFGVDDTESGRTYFMIERGEVAQVGATTYTVGDNCYGIVFKKTSYAVPPQYLQVGIIQSDMSVSYLSGSYNGVLLIKCKKLYKSTTGNVADVFINKDNIPYQVINAGDSVLEVAPIDDVDRTDSRLVKIVKLPYCPIKLVTGSLADQYLLPESWEFKSGMLSINASELLNINFENTIDASFDINLFYSEKNYPTTIAAALAQPSTPATNAAFYSKEPKLFHSDFTLNKFVFDNFHYELPLELHSINSRGYHVGCDKATIKMIASTSISSTFMFSVEPNYGNIDGLNDYEGFFTVKRNNELPIFTNGYLNYIRNGYNFDLKSKAISNATSITQTVISAVGAIASFASTPYTGAAGVASGIGFIGGLVSGGVGAVATLSNNQLSLASKLEQLMAQGSSVNGSDEIDLLAKYSRQLMLKTYELSDVDKNRVYHLLRLKGYACDEYGIPNTHTRLYYNHVQCDAEFEMSTQSSKLGPNAEIYESVKNLFKEGVTFMHNPNNAGYDIEMNYENYELSLLGE